MPSRQLGRLAFAAHKRPGTLTVAAFFCLALLFALRHHPATSHRIGAGARRRADDARSRVHRPDRSHQRTACRAHFASDRADQQSRQRDGWER
jgi:hypothetical protein